MTSLFTLTTEPNQSSSQTDQETGPPSSPWTTTTADPKHTNADAQPERLISPYPELSCSDRDTSFLCGNDGTFCDPKGGNTDFRLDLNSSFGGPDHRPQRRSGGEPWTDERSGERVFLSGRRGTAEAVEGVERESVGWTPRALKKLDSPFKLDSTFTDSPVSQRPASSYTSMFSTVRRPAKHSLSRPNEVTPWGRIQSGSHYRAGTGETKTISANYGSKCWIGRERKRNGDVPESVGAGE